MDSIQRDIKKVRKIAYEVQSLSKQRLLVRLPFLNLAVYGLEETADEKTQSIYTDGRVYGYNPVNLLKAYANEKSFVARAYLHCVLHCVFRHSFVSMKIQKEKWNLACDIAVENIINQLQLDILTTEKCQEQLIWISRIKRATTYLTAERMYAYLCSRENDDFEMLCRLFYVDDHSVWYKHFCENDSEKYSNKECTSVKEKSDQIEALQAKWTAVSEQIQVELETFIKAATGECGDLIFNIKEVNREKYDYTEFLRKFARLGESMQVDMDEFDYNYYMYGLDLYDNLPLVEPLEYKEVRKIKDFVIVIDTSGSVSDGLVQNFVTKTYNILNQTQSFFTDMNLHIIQCDARVQKDEKITSQQEFDSYIQSMKLYGGGGTDFRSAFEYVEHLVHSGELVNLKGMIYFTDGMGIYPKKKPAFEVAFVFIGNTGAENRLVPSWAMKLELEEGDLTMERGRDDRRI